MPKAAVIYNKGGPDVFKWEEVDILNPKCKEVKIKNTAIGVNFVDLYHRNGTPHPWAVPDLPLVLGFEGVGYIKEIGSKVKNFSLGDRVAYALPPHGAYSEERLYPEAKLLKVPSFLSRFNDEDIAAVMLKGLTAQYLLKRTYNVQKGETILVHAAAGGMGLILCQWAKYLGATIIGTVSSEEKAQKAYDSGADYVVIHKKESFLKKVLEITDGVGCSVVYESIGKDTFRESIECLRKMGMLACYGHASGPPDPVDVIELGSKGSLFLTRPAIMHYMSKREDLVASAKDLFNVLSLDVIKPNINQKFPLCDVGKAHKFIEERKTTGSTVLIP